MSVCSPFIVSGLWLIETLRNASYPPSDSAEYLGPSSSSDQEEEEEEIPEREAAREAARKQIEEDLAFYTEKFNKHADEAIESLGAQVDKMVTTAMKSKGPDVEKEMKMLDKLLEKEIRVIKSTIMDLAKFYKPGKTEEETKSNKLNSFDKLFETTSSAGKLIKERVQDIRWDSQKFLASVFDEVAAAADIHIDKVDGLIDAGIQELGMKWAWEAEGVTYKDWARYQDLRKEFSGIRTRVIQAAEKNQKLAEFTNWGEGESWEGGAFTRAKAAVEEIGRLKRVGKRKIELGDSSEDFSDKYLTSSSDTKPEVFEVEKNTVSAVAGNGNTPIVIGKAEVVGEQNTEYDDQVNDSLTEKLKDSVDDVKEAMKHASKAVFEAIYGTPTDKSPAESVTSIASEIYNSALAAASSALYGTPQPKNEELFSIATDKYSAAVAAASSIIYGTPAPTPWSEKAYNAYQDAVAEAAEIYQQVLVDISKSVGGEPQPAHESILAAADEKFKAALMLAQQKYTMVIDSASSAIYGTPQPTPESIISVANEKYSAAVLAAQQGYSDLVDRASTAIIGTPTPPAGSIASVIPDKDSSWKKVASENVYGTSQPASEHILFSAGGAAEQECFPEQDGGGDGECEDCCG